MSSNGFGCQRRVPVVIFGNHICISQNSDDRTYKNATMAYVLTIFHVFDASFDSIEPKISKS